MKEQGFYIEKVIPSKWWVMVYADVKTESDLEQVYGAILAAGAGNRKAANAVTVLSEPNTGYIYSNLERQFSLIAVAHATNYAEMFNSVNHEINHLTAHVCEWFMYQTGTEKSAYIQGEISEKMYPIVAMSICPKCNCGRRHE